MRGATPSAFEFLLGAAASKHPLAGSGLSPDVSARRARQRRQMLDMIGISYTIDAVILMIYAYAGATTFAVAPAYLACGLLSVAGFIALSETRVNDRFKEHYFITQQTSVSLAIMLLFIYFAPEVGCVFLCSIFLVFTFAALRSNARQTLIGWTAAAVGLTILFCFTDKPIGMPIATSAERLATMLIFVLVLARGMVVGLFSSSLHESLYKRGIELKEAYKRIEELAELDELTGSLNRRSIMRALDEEIVRVQRGTNNCAIVLIDLDWFKRINDRFGHPAGDEVLRTFAITIFANIRSIDKFGRYGGEEFLLILPETADGAAERTIDRLRTIVAELDWTAISHGLVVTMSAGIATLGPDDTVDSILVRADAALYRAKALGRNRVVLV
ncbi:MAG TPA: GGDEF domain-containing protein [Afipia sp.]